MLQVSTFKMHRVQFILKRFLHGDVAVDRRASGEGTESAINYHHICRNTFFHYDSSLRCTISFRHFVEP